MYTDTGTPRFIAADHVSWTVADLEGVARFYKEVFGARELYRIGPIDAADLPVDGQGRDWMLTHVGVAGARLTLVMLDLVGNLKLQLVQYDKPGERRRILPRNCDLGGHHLALLVENVESAAAFLQGNGCLVLETIAMHDGPLAGKKCLYVQDPWGHQLELVD